MLWSLKVKITTPITRIISNNKHEIYGFLSDGVNFKPLGEAHVMTYLSPQKQNKKTLPLAKFPNEFHDVCERS